MFYYDVPSSIGRQKISLKQAQTIALQHIPGKIIHVDVDLEHGVLVYEVFVLTGQNKVYEIEILAKSGQILKVEEENDLD